MVFNLMKANKKLKIYNKKNVQLVSSEFCLLFFGWYTGTYLFIFPFLTINITVVSWHGVIL